MSSSPFLNNPLLRAPSVGDESDEGYGPVSAPAPGSASAAPDVTAGPSMVPAAAPPPPPPPLNPRSCILCRRRKVKCDKCSPCSNCAKANLVCTFPAPGRAPRRSRKPSEGELLSRLRKLEGVVKELRGGDSGPAEAADRAASKQASSSGAADDAGPASGADALSQAAAPEPERPVKILKQHKTLEKSLGRLVIDEGKSRYVSSSFWASLTDELDDIRGMLDESSDEEGDQASPDSGRASSMQDHQGFIFGFSSLMVDFARLHPSPERMEKLWEMYVRGVDPMVKILHRPTMQRTMVEAKDRPHELGKPCEALLFAIYFAAATSLTAAECERQLGEDQATLVARYRFATEQALARADFLSSHEIAVLQALVLYLTCVRPQHGARFIWSVAGLAIRMALSLGLHRDGAEFALSPFEVEMRRRLWWNICALDVRTSEDHGSDPTITEQIYDTKVPLNINDDDMSPDSLEPITPRLGSTEMTFCLVRFEVCKTSRKFHYIPPGIHHCPNLAHKVSRETKERWIEECHQTLEEKYLQYLDMTDPLSWVSATVVRLIMARMWLMLYHPFRQEAASPPLSEDTRDRLFVTSIEVIEYARLLETERSTVQWGWRFRTFVQWHAIACILSDLCSRTSGPYVDRAWRAVDGVFDHWGEQVSHQAQRGLLWRPMRKLMAKARRARELARAEERRRTETGSMQGPFGSGGDAVAAGLPTAPMGASMPGGSVAMAVPVPVPAAAQVPSFAPYVTAATAELAPTEPAPTELLATAAPAAGWLVGPEPAATMAEPALDPAADACDVPVDWANWDRMVSDLQLQGGEDKGRMGGGVGGIGSGWW